MVDCCPCCGLTMSDCKGDMVSKFNILLLPIDCQLPEFRVSFSNSCKIILLFHFIQVTCGMCLRKFHRKNYCVGELIVNMSVQNFTCKECSMKSNVQY